MRFFATSIWDETLYRAWSQIVNSLIPNVKVLQTQLNDFANVCAADEVVLFERATFLVIADVSRLKEENYDGHRFERISNIIKQVRALPSWCFSLRTPSLVSRLALHPLPPISLSPSSSSAAARHSRSSRVWKSATRSSPPS